MLPPTACVAERRMGTPESRKNEFRLLFPPNFLRSEALEVRVTPLRIYWGIILIQSEEGMT
jgi:hypothetical protein